MEIGLARSGKKVLLIDANLQGSLTASLGYVEPDEIHVKLANILTAVINGEEKIKPESDDRRDSLDNGRFQNKLCKRHCLKVT